MEYVCINKKGLIITKTKSQLQESKLDTKRYESGWVRLSQLIFYFFMKINLIINIGTPYFIIIILLYITYIYIVVVKLLPCVLSFYLIYPIK